MAERSQAKSVDYASFHKTFEVNCPVKSGKQTHNEELERQKNPSNTTDSPAVENNMQRNRRLALPNQSENISGSVTPVGGPGMGLHHTPRKMHNMPKFV
ncbi:unnamed protein product [Oikopleura dioica]|uniref:Uncharacterized protein n=1 Tax=Oikopleura dioica TaxID=34765 RepID=E4YU02_OIKDI|nr:unnamed protein product [Oikopleura dioica]